MPSHRQNGTRPRSRNVRCSSPCGDAADTGDVDITPMVVLTAAELFETGHWAEALELLDPHLRGRTLTDEAPDPVLVHACSMYAALTTDTPLPAATYAYRAARSLYPDPGHLRRLETSTIYANVLHRHGRTADAIDLYQKVLRTVQAYGRPVQTLSIAMNLAVCQHTVGRCVEALQQLRTAWTVWQHSGLTENSPFGGQLLAVYAGQLAACRQTRDLHDLLHHPRLHPDWPVTLPADLDEAITAHQQTVCTHRPQAQFATHAEHHHPALGPGAVPVARPLSSAGSAVVEYRRRPDPGRYPLTGQKAGGVTQAAAMPTTLHAQIPLRAGHPDASARAVVHRGLVKDAIAHLSRPHTTVLFAVLAAAVTTALALLF